MSKKINYTLKVFREKVVWRKWLNLTGVHLFFWLAYLLYDTVSFGAILGSFSAAFVRSCFQGILLVSMVYINLIFVYPYFLKRGKVTNYILFSVLLGTIFCSMRLGLDIYYLSPKVLEEGKFNSNKDLILENLIEIKVFPDYQVPNDNQAEYDRILDEKRKAVLTEKVYQSFQAYAWFYPIGMLIGTLIVYGIFSTLRLVLDSYLKHEKEQMYLRAENLRLRTQLNQHFLFNALGRINYQFQRTEDRLGTELTQDLKWMIQYATEKCAKNKRVTLAEELVFAQKYLSFHDYLSGNIDIPTISLIYQNLGVMPMLLNPLLENAIKHGNLNDKNGFLKINIEMSDSHISFSIKNSIPSTKDTISLPLTASLGIGLNNLRNRLEVFYQNSKMYDLEYGKDIDTNTFTVSLRVPREDMQGTAVIRHTL